MNKITMILGLFFCLGLLVNPALAGDFDGSKALICAAMDVVECLPGGECKRVLADEVDFPDFLQLNFKDKKIRVIFRYFQLGRRFGHVFHCVNSLQFHPATDDSS